MIRKLLFVLLISILFCSCFSMSEHEKKAVATITSLWGGQCMISRQSSFETNNGHRKVLIVSLSGSKSFNAGWVTPQLVASNMALAIYRQWGQKEKEEYTAIRCKVMHGADGESSAYEHEYKVTQMEKVIANQDHYYYCANMLIHRQFDSLTAKMDTSVIEQSQIKGFTYTLDTMSSRFDSVYGVINKDSIVGFEFGTLPFKGDTLRGIRYIGMLIRKQSATKFEAVVNTKKTIDQQFLYDIYLTELNTFK